MREKDGESNYSVPSMAKWWMWRANEAGEHEANQNLDAFFECGEITRIASLWINGIEVPRRIKLTNDMEIVPIEEMPQSQEREQFLEARKYRHNGPESPHFPKTALIKTFKTPKIFDDIESHRCLSDHYADLSDLSIIANCMPNVLCCPLTGSCALPPHIPPGPFSLRLLYFVPPYHGIFPIRRSKACEKNFDGLKHILDMFSRIQNKTKKDSVKRALKRLMQAKAHQDIHEKALDLGISLEMLLLNEHISNIKNEGRLDNLSLHFRLRGSLLLGGTSDEKRKNYGTLNQIYNHRSYIAHTGHYAELDKKPRLREVVESEHISLAETIFREIIVRDDIDWKGLVLGIPD